ncbi:MAG: DUF5678 domain-containing protein [Candidatus Heimdallarchaeaceae archaeon]
MENELQILNNIENDSKWLYSQYEKIRENFSEKFVAIKNNRVIEADKSMENLINKLEKKGEDPALILIKFIPKKGTVLIL